MALVDGDAHSVDQICGRGEGHGKIDRRARLAGVGPLPDRVIIGGQIQDFDLGDKPVAIRFPDHDATGKNGSVIAHSEIICRAAVGGGCPGGGDIAVAGGVGRPQNLGCRPVSAAPLRTEIQQPGSPLIESVEGHDADAQIGGIHEAGRRDQLHILGGEAVGVDALIKLHLQAVHALSHQAGGRKTGDDRPVGVGLDRDLDGSRIRPAAAFGADHGDAVRSRRKGVEIQRAAGAQRSIAVRAPGVIIRGAAAERYCLEGDRPVLKKCAVIGGRCDADAEAQTAANGGRDAGRVRVAAVPGHRVKNHVVRLQAKGRLARSRIIIQLASHYIGESHQRAIGIHWNGAEAELAKEGIDADLAVDAVDARLENRVVGGQHHAAAVDLEIFVIVLSQVLSLVLPAAIPVGGNNAGVADEILVGARIEPVADGLPVRGIGIAVAREVEHPDLVVGVGLEQGRDLSVAAEIHPGRLGPGGYERLVKMITVTVIASPVDVDKEGAIRDHVAQKQGRRWRTGDG